MVTTDLHNKSGLNALSTILTKIRHPHSNDGTVEPLSFPTNTVVGWKLK